MSKPTIAYVTATAAREVDEDLAPLESALRDTGADVTIAEWDRPHDWSRFDVALLRSTWDYPQRLAEFFGWAEPVSRQTRLLNPFPVVKWSSDKHYLSDLSKKGIACSALVATRSSAASGVRPVTVSFANSPVFGPSFLFKIGPLRIA